jgi:hypothetical protein
MSQAIRAKKFRTGGRFTKRSNAPKNFWKKIDSLLKSSILYHMKTIKVTFTNGEVITTSINGTRVNFSYDISLANSFDSDYEMIDNN